jgi:putative adhesin
VAPAVAGGSGGWQRLTISRSGPIDVRDAPGGAILVTNSGDIHVGHVGRQVVATTSSGNVTVESLDGAARLQTAAGDIAVRISERGGDVEATSATGTVTVYLPTGFDGELELETAYTRGHAPTRIVSDVPVALTESAWDASRGTPTKYVRGRARVGGGRHHVTVRTVDGDVRVVRGGGPARALLGGADVECGAGCTLTLPAAATPGTVLAADSRGYAWENKTADERIALTATIARGTPTGAAAEVLGRVAFRDADPRVQAAAVAALAGMAGGERDAQLHRISREHPSAALRRRASDALR